MLFKQCSYEEIYNIVNNNKNKNTTYYHFSESLFVILGDGDYDEEFCEENKIPHFQSKLNHGTIVANSGDIELRVCCENPLRVERSILQKIATRTNSVLMGNDIMYHNHKLGSAISDGNVIGIQLTYNADIDIIKKICKKPMAKVPGGYSEAGLNRDQMFEIVKTAIIEAVEEENRKGASNVK